MCTKCFKSGKHLFFALFILSILMISGCGKSDSSSNAKGSASESGIDNNPVYGAYSINLTVGSCPAQQASLIIGNDPSRAQDDSYIYLPDNQSSYTLSGLTISRNANKVTISGTQDTETKSIEVVFNSDFTSGTVSGTLSDTKPGGCSGNVKGDISLITRTPVEINSKYLQYQSFSNSSVNGQAAWAGCIKNSQAILASDIKDVRLYKGKIDPANLAGTAKSPDNFSQGTTYTGSYDKNTGTVNISSNPSSWAGFSVNLSKQYLAWGDYVLAATVPDTDTSKGYTVTSHFHYPYPGDTTTSVFTGLNTSWSGAGLVLSWSNPVKPKDDYDNIMISIVKTSDCKTGRVLMAVSVDKADGVSGITITNDKMELVKTLANSTSEFGVLAFQIQARKITDQGINYASGFSDMVILPNTSNWTNLDNSIFYGAYTLTRTVGNCAQETGSIIIGNDAGKADNDDYIYLPMNSLTSVTAMTTAIRKDRATINIARNYQPSSEQNLTLAFNVQDLSTAGISGTISGSSGCTGNVKGTLTLITRTPVTITSPYVSAVFPHPASPYLYEIGLGLEKNGSAITSGDVSAVSLLKTDGSFTLNYTDIGTIFQMQEKLYGTVNANGSIDLIRNEPYSWSGICTNWSNAANLMSGDYIFHVTAKEGYTISSKINIPEYSVITVANTGLTATYQTTDGSMALTWTIPSAIDFMYVNILKTDSDKTYKKYLLTINVNPKNGTTAANIQKSLTDRLISMAGTFGESDILSMEVQTVKIAANGMIQSVGYSSRLVKNF